MTAAAATAELVASSPLGVLDELRVPYRAAGRRARGAWARFGTGDEGRALHWRVGATGRADGPWTIGATPAWGGMADDAEVARFAATLDGSWHPEVAIHDRDGARRASIWRSHEGGAILPFDPDELVAVLRSERYGTHGGGGASAKALARRTYYAARPALPRPAQIALRRAFSRVQARTPFPRWPVETALHDLCDLVAGLAAAAAGEPLPCIAPWPGGREWAVVLTHDVETARGRDAIERVRAVEAAAGLRSSWNLVPERYAVPDALVAHLRAVGCEVGVHGLRHDGRDLESLATLRRRLPEMRRWADRWDAAGFRSPATHRVHEWMPLLGFEYDSSSPDTDPYEPMPGGCCSWRPFFNGAMVELPITLPQDHTVFVILRRDESLWLDKAAVLRARGGMALLITHPDYLVDDALLRGYERFLEHVRDDATAWTPLPREVSAWWRRRAVTTPVRHAGGWRPAGAAAAEASVDLIAPLPPRA